MIINARTGHHINSEYTIAEVCLETSHSVLNYVSYDPVVSEVYHGVYLLAEYRHLSHICLTSVSLAQGSGCQSPGHWALDD